MNINSTQSELCRLSYELTKLTPQKLKFLENGQIVKNREFASKLEIVRLNRSDVGIRFRRLHWTPWTKLGFLDAKLEFFGGRKATLHFRTDSRRFANRVVLDPF